VPALLAASAAGRQRTVTLLMGWSLPDRAS